MQGVSMRIAVPLLFNDYYNGFNKNEVKSNAIMFITR